MVPMQKFERVALAAVLLNLISFSARAQGLPAAPGAQVTTLSAQPGTWSEPGIAVNPLNPQQVVAVFQYVAQAAYSNDAGHTWTLARGVAPPEYKMSGDVSVTFDNQGHAILGCIAFDKLGTFNYWAHNATRNGIFVKRSLDGGKTWEPQLRTVVAQKTEPGIPFEDKPYFAADTSKSRYAGNLYVGWTRWTIGDSRMLFSRSTDDGLTWSKPIEIARDRGTPRDDNGALEGFDGAVGPDGAVYGVWSERNQIEFVESHDGGVTLSRARDIIPTAPIMFAIQGMDRANGFPNIAIDPRGGPKGGNLYVTWSDLSNGEIDVFLSVSGNHGRTWSAPVKVNTDPVHNGADHFFQWLAVDPVTGGVYVVFYDRRKDPENKSQIVVLARSNDGGRTFTNYTWTNTPVDPEGVFMGDYLALAAWDNRVYGSWTVRKGKEDKTSVQVGVADFGSPAPSPQ
jgi:hypothetical protein